MKPQLVKIDVAAADLGKSVARIFDLVDGGTPEEAGLLWCFDLSKNIGSKRRDLRFWRPELTARAQGDQQKYCRMEITAVIAMVLPEQRESFHAGEVDQLLQMRPRTRIDLGADLPGRLKDRRHTYSRQALESFLKRRWIGAAIFKVKGKGVPA